MKNVLLLNADGSPIQVLPWERAAWLVLDNKVAVIAAYAWQIRSPSFAMAWPAVVTLKRYVRARLNVGMTRRNVLARDRFICQYCSVQPRTPRGQPLLERLTMDHVVPRSRAVQGRVVQPWTGRRICVGAWENLVASCIRCNQRKGARTPAEASMPLLRYPTKPDYTAMIGIALAEFCIPKEWHPFIPESSWRRS